MAGIRLEDEQFVDLYSDYTTLLAKGEKVSYIVAILSWKSHTNLTHPGKVF